MIAIAPCGCGRNIASRPPRAERTLVAAADAIISAHRIRRARPKLNRIACPWPIRRLGDRRDRRNASLTGGGRA
jgi:hypothetical protein